LTLRAPSDEQSCTAVFLAQSLPTGRFPHTLVKASKTGVGQTVVDKAIFQTETRRTHCKNRRKTFLQ